MTVRDIYNVSMEVCKVFNYYSGADYGYAREEVMDMHVEKIKLDTLNNGDKCICIAVS